MKMIISAMFLVAALSASPATADEMQSRGEGRAIVVQHQDLDLAERGDAAIMLRRIEWAARRACEVPEVSRPRPELRRAIEACREEAVAEAVASLRSLTMDRAYASTGK